MAKLIAYDISGKHTQFKNEMYLLGYRSSIPGIQHCKEIFFPNTTLYHNSCSSESARKDAQRVCCKLDIKLERFVATNWENWAAICGEPYSK